jgi:hypothetical protein
VLTIRNTLYSCISLFLYAELLLHVTVITVHLCEQGEKANITDTYSTKNVLPTPDTALGGHNDVAIVAQNITTVDGARVSFTNDSTSTLCVHASVHATSTSRQRSCQQYCA